MWKIGFQLRPQLKESDTFSAVPASNASVHSQDVSLDLPMPPPTPPPSY